MCCDDWSTLWNINVSLKLFGRKRSVIWVFLKLKVLLYVRNVKLWILKFRNCKLTPVEDILILYSRTKSYLHLSSLLWLFLPQNIISKKNYIFILLFLNFSSINRSTPSVACAYPPFILSEYFLDYGKRMSYLEVFGRYRNLFI